MEPYNQLLFVGACLLALAYIFWPGLPEILALLVMLLGGAGVAILAGV